jgi:hypothetical protein
VLEVSNAARIFTLADIGREDGTTSSDELDYLGVNFRTRDAGDLIPSLVDFAPRGR